jgi:hypothetical protein
MAGNPAYVKNYGSLTFRFANVTYICETFKTRLVFGAVV